MQTIQINDNLLAEAKRKADRERVDLNAVVETLIRHYISVPVAKRSIKVTPFVESLGVDCGLTPDYDERAEYRKHLEEKYR